jgi:ABC-type molybdate transport system substrate-binding protein
MNSTAKRTIGIVLAVVLVAGIVAAVLIGRGAGSGTGHVTKDAKGLTIVTGVIGSEKAPFFADPEVKKEFAAHGLNVQVTTAGSRQIATTVD